MELRHVSVGINVNFSPRLAGVFIACEAFELLRTDKYSGVGDGTYIVFQRVSREWTSIEISYREKKHWLTTMLIYYHHYELNCRYSELFGRCA